MFSEEMFNAVIKGRKTQTMVQFGLVAHINRKNLPTGDPLSGNEKTEYFD